MTKKLYNDQMVQIVERRMKPPPPSPTPTIAVCLRNYQLTLRFITAINHSHLSVCLHTAIISKVIIRVTLLSIIICPSLSVGHFVVVDLDVTENT